MEQALAPSGRHDFPVVDGDHVVEVLTLQCINETPRDRRASTRTEGVQRLPVVEDERFLGMVASDTQVTVMRTGTERTQAV